MHRSVLSAVFVIALSTSASGVAFADGTVAAPAVAGTLAARVTDAAPAADAAEVLPPVAGAVALWPASTASIAERSNPGSKRADRLRRFASGIVTRSSAIASSLTRSAMRFIGAPYVFGGTRATGFDCSGYVQHVFAMLGMHLPRTADMQFQAGRRVVASMHPGDLVFFHTYAPGVSHVGIYLGHSRFIHSSSTRGVAVSSLHDTYWAPRYLGVKRVFGS